MRARSALLLGGLTAAALVAATAPAVADDIYNTLDGTVDATAESINLGVGQSGSVVLAVEPTNGDGKNGCNLTGQTALVVGVHSSSPGVATAGPSQLTFDSCGAVRTVAVQAVAPGATTVSLSLVSNDTGGTFDLSTATFTVNVGTTAPPNTPPTLHLPSNITAEATGPGGATVTYSATATDVEDGSDGVLCTPASGSVFALGATTVNCSATDSNGATTTGSFTVTVVDTTAPVVTISTTAAEAGTGWYNITSSGTAGVAIQVSATDAVGAASPTCTDNGGPLPLDSAGDATLYDGVHHVACSAADAAGNPGSADRTFQVDQTAPTISASYDPAPNSAGWNNSNVTLSYTCGDATSGVATCPPDDIVSTEGATTLTPVVTDVAGNSATRQYAVDLDKTAPTITGGPDRAANSNGWYNADVTVKFTCGDSLSGLASCSGSTTLGEGANQSVTGNASDIAGNTNSLEVGDINIDETAPQISYSRTAANSNGWNNGPVTVTFTCTDGLSGVDTVTAPVTISADTTGQTATGTCADKAGNTASVTTDPIKIDTTAPVITGSRSPAANVYGWNNTDVSVSFTCSDAGTVQSGIATNTVAGDTLSGEGAGQSVTNTGACIDAAGNAAGAATVGDINIDVTAPTVTVTADRAPNSNGWYNSQLTASASGTDALSTVASCDPPTSYSGPDTASETFTLTCADKAGNVGTGTLTIRYDATPPTLAPTVSPNPVVLNGAATASPNAMDATSGVAMQSCAAVNTGTVGTGQSVSCTATDLAGNTVTGNAAYAVVYATGGNCLGSPGHAILQPINADGSSVFKLGSTVPAKFRVCDANGVSIGTPALVTSFKLVSRTSSAVTSVNEDVTSTTPDTTFRWDPSAQQWIFNISTKSGFSSGANLGYLVTLNDGSTIPFSFSLR